MVESDGEGFADDATISLLLNRKHWNIFEQGMGDTCTVLELSMWHRCPGVGGERRDSSQEE